MTLPAGPPAQPPRLSPDGKWFWDGTQWRPIAVHEAIFKNWQSVGASLPPETAAPAQRIPTPPPTGRPVPPPRVPVYRAPVVAPVAPQSVAPPLWEEPRAGTGLNKYMYGAAALIGLIVVGIVLSSMGAITFPWEKSPPDQVAAKPTPGAATRSDAARADHFINDVLATPLAAVGDNVALVREACPAGMTASCQDALVGVDNKVSVFLPVVDRESVPQCIATPASRFRADLAKLDAAAQLGIKGFKDNRLGEVQSGAAQVPAYYNAVANDVNAMSAAAKVCDTQLVGP